MTLMLAGSTAAIEAAKPVTDALANRCFVIGERAGDATKVKLLNNLLAGIHLAAGAQVLRLADDFEPRSYLHILSKDVVLANEMLAANGYALPLGSDAQAVFQAGLNAGHTQLDDCALFLLPAAKTVKKSV
jgi:3-hydroxyisobutyrate dehydrogenase